MTPFDSLSFRYHWRPYQARVLSAIHEHLSDHRLHVVAAPGAGKTTLGLEIFRLLKKPAIVLSPTRVIRDQWIDRLRDFCDTTDPNTLDWVSNSSHEPRTFTSITYQALHAQFSDELAEPQDSMEDNDGLDESELNSFITMIGDHRIGVLILDEAHHLRSEWWRALDQVCTRVPGLILVSLTATPPYDATGNEWMRYEQLCGPIDEEISVPELVKANTLCAHQDFIWACDATANEKKQIARHDQRVSAFLQSLFDANEFESIVLAHPWLNKQEIESEIIQQPEIAISILSYLQAKSLTINKQLLKILDLTERDIPELGRKWWQVLIESILFTPRPHLREPQTTYLESLKKQLRASELLIKRELCLVRSRSVERYLSLSSAKIQACAELHQLEYKQRQSDLRQVFLCDYIRDETIASDLDTGKPNLGAWPIFRTLILHSPIQEEVALLTGRLCILHASKTTHLHNVIDVTKLTTEPISGAEDYVRIIGPTSLLSNAFTALLCAGHIKTLIGTRSLLGEGWDAPVVNSLVLASSIGSFMLTNQMRGRAIRVDNNTPEKISSIWHLVAINPESFSGWTDYNNLVARFDSFVGLAEKGLTIESGFERLNSSELTPKIMPINAGLSMVRRNNRKMAKRLGKLSEIKHRWDKALIVNHSARVIPSVRTDKAPRLRTLLLSHSFAHLVSQITIALFTAMLIYNHLLIRSQGELPVYAILLFLGGAFIYRLPQSFRALKILFNHLPVDGSLKQIGYALTDALCCTGLIQTSYRTLRVNVSRNLEGKFSVSLTGSTFYESSLFSDCLAEILAPIENPRYIVLRMGTFFGLQRDDYHAVPMKLGVKKEFAQLFFAAWCRHVGLSELIYTRTVEGKKRLLKARMHAFSSNFSHHVKRQDRWQ